CHAPASLNPACSNDIFSMLLLYGQEKLIGIKGKLLKKFSLKPFQNLSCQRRRRSFASAFGAYQVKRYWEMVFSGIQLISDFDKKRIVGAVRWVALIVWIIAIFS
ncbi:MAG TPA: hypothetical protein PLS19_10545, partial [bacterium]|nr:hypothetical protein [bacterium]